MAAPRGMWAQWPGRVQVAGQGSRVRAQGASHLRPACPALALTARHTAVGLVACVAWRGWQGRDLWHAVCVGKEAGKAGAVKGPLQKVG